MSQAFAWLGRTETDRLENENIAYLKTSSPSRGEAAPDGVAPSVDGYPEDDWSALIATCCFLLIVLAVLCTVLGVR